MPLSKTKNCNFNLKFLFLWFFVLLNVTFLVAESCSAETIAIISNNQNVSQLSLSELRNIYMGKKKNWSNGERIVLFLPPSGSQTMVFLTKKVFKTDKEVNISKFYLKAIFRQTFSTPPKSILDAEEAILEIIANPGGIAIIDSRELSPGSQINIVKLTNGT